MSTRLKGRAYSLEENAKYDVYVDDGAPTTGTIPDIEIVDLSVRHEAASKDIDANLLLSKATVTFRVQNSTQETVFSDMAGAEELRFRIRITKDDSLFYVGFVLLDLLTIDDDSGDYNLKIEATDGIGRLKSIDYDGGGPFYDDYETVIGHLQAILSAVPLTEYYTEGDEYLRIGATMWPDGLTPDGSTDQFGLIRFSYRAFRTIDSQGATKFSSYYDVLQEICKAFGVRFMYSNGRYVITDISDYSRLTGTVRFLRYDIGFNQLATQNLTTWGDWQRSSGELSEYLDGTHKYVTRAGGKISALPALREVSWSYKHYSKQNTLPTSSVWTNGSNPSPAIQNFVTAPSLQLRISAAAQLEVIPPPGETYPSVPVHVVVGMRVWVTDADSNQQSLTRTFNIAGSQVNYNQDEWVSGASQSIFCPFVFNVPQVFSASPSYQIDKLTAVVPASGTLRVQFYISQVLKSGSPWTGADVNYNIHSPYMETTLDGSVVDQYNFSNFSATNTNFTNSSLKLERSSVLGDGPTDNTFGRFEYFDGTDWLRVSQWRKSAGGSYIDASGRRHGALRAKDILALQEAPRRKIQGTLILKDYAPEYLYVRASARYLPYKAEHDLINDRVTGEWLQISYVPANTTDPTEEPTDTGPDFDSDGAIPDPTDGGTVTPPIVVTGGDPPGLATPGETVAGLNTVVSDLEDQLAVDTPADVIPVTATPLQVPLYEGDIITITDPATGQQQQVTVAYDSEIGVPTDNQVNPTTPPAFPYYGPDGLVWMIASDTEVAVESFTPGHTFPTNSFLQFDSAYLARLRALLRRDHVDALIAGYDTTLTTGFKDWYWRPERRQGWHISKVHFAFAQAGTGQAKVNLKYYDASGFRYTVATHDATAGLGSVQDAFAVVAEGYYRVEVETLTGTAPKGLTVTIEVIKILPSA